MNPKNPVKFIWNNPVIFMPLITAVWGIFYISSGAVINAGEGLGYDGAWYSHITKNLFELISDHELSIYRIQRILPCFIVKFILTVFSLPQENYFIVKVFQYYNLMLLILSAVIWNKISVIYKFKYEIIWTGFFLGFINFGNFMMPFFYPVLTDVTAFFLGFCLLYFYLKNNLPAKIIVTVLGAFTWPLFMITGLLMIIFPVTFKISTEGLRNDNLKIYNKLFIFLIPLPFLVISLININSFFSGAEIKDIHTQPVKSMLYVSSVLNFLLLSYFMFALLPHKISFSSYFRLLKRIISDIDKRIFALCILIFVFVQVIYRLLGNADVESETNTGLILYNIAMYGSTKPLVYVVTAVTYFGPLYMILFLFIKNYKCHLINTGAGVYLAFLMTFILTLSSETRLIMNYIPVIILVTMLVIRDLKFSSLMLVFLTISAVVLSKFYIPMSGVPDNADKFSFKSQMYFMNTYMISKNFYYYQGIFILALFVLLFLLYKRGNTKLS